MTLSNSLLFSLMLWCLTFLSIHAIVFHLSFRSLDACTLILIYFLRRAFIWDPYDLFCIFCSWTCCIPWLREPVVLLWWYDSCIIWRAEHVMLACIFIWKMTLFNMIPDWPCKYTNFFTPNGYGLWKDLM